MSIRAIGALLCGAAFLVATQTGAFAVEDKKKKADPTSATATTVKSSKSNTSDRMGGGGGKGSASARWVTSFDIRTQTECGKIKGVWSAKSKTCKVKTN